MDGVRIEVESLGAPCRQPLSEERCRGLSLGRHELFNHAPLLANVLLHSREAVICGFWQGLHSAAPWRRAEVFEKPRSVEQVRA